MAKNNKGIWIIIGLVVLALFFMNGREAKTDFTRTFDKKVVSPGDTITVTYKAINLGTEDPWIGELLLPPGYEAIIPVVATNMDVTPEGNVRFYAFGTQTVTFMIKPTLRGQEAMEGFIYHPKDDKTYIWCVGGISCDYVADIITSSCLTITDLNGYLKQWLRNEIAITDMIKYIKDWLTHPCPA